VFIAEESPYLREIAYEMCKVINNKNHYFNEGYFGWVKFEIDPSTVPALHAELELDPNIIRSLITVTVRENTVYTKRPAGLKRGDDETTEEISETEEVAEEVVAPEVEAAEVAVETAE
jgi:ribosomal protein S6